ncbi:MAG: cache domain-containing protein [Planctomycetota bacterium]
MAASPRARQVVIALAVLLPALCLSLLGLARERTRAARLSERHARELARLLAMQQESTIEEARGLLVVLSRLPAVRGRNTSACASLFVDAIRGSARYANVGMLAADGTVLASGLAEKGPMSLGDRPYFKRAVRSRCFSIGDYQIGRLTGRPTINVALPLLDAMGNVENVLFAALDLSGLDEAFARMALPSGSAVLLLDPSGTVAAWVPERAETEGHAFPDSPLVKAMREGTEGAIEAEGLDGAARWFGYAPVAVEGGEGMPRVAVGVPLEAADAGYSGALWLSLGGLGVLAIVALALACAWGRV